MHFQPVSYFGRFPAAPRDADRITIPEVLRLIEEQTEGKFNTAEFYPASGENPYCSFHGKFWLYPNGKIVPAARPATVSCCGPSPESTLVQLGTVKREEGAGARRAQRFVAQHWALPAGNGSTLKQSEIEDGINTASLDAFLAEDKQSFCISGMAFQDAWNLDLERLRECFLHVLNPQQKLVPLCAYNLTGINGQTLYRAQSYQSRSGRSDVMSTVAACFAKSPLEDWIAKRMGASTPSLTRATIEQHQLKALQETVAWTRSHSSFCAHRLASFPVDFPRSLNEVPLLPLTTATDIAENTPGFLVRFAG